MRRRRKVSALALALLLCCSADAAADPSAEALSASRAAFERGKVAYRLGQFGPALKEFKTALGLVNRPSVIFNVAQCHRQLKQLEKAVFYYRLYLDEWTRQHPDRPSPLLAEVKGRIKRLIEAIRLRDRPRPAAARPAPRELVTVDIDSEPSGAEVTLNSRVRGTTPLRLNLPRGEFYSLTLERALYLPIKTTLDVKRRLRLRRTLQLGPAGVEVLRDRNDWVAASFVVAADLGHPTDSAYLGAMLRAATLRWGRFYWSVLEATLAGGSDMLLDFGTAGGVVLYPGSQYRHQFHLGLGAGGGQLGHDSGVHLNAHARYQFHAWRGALLALEVRFLLQLPGSEVNDSTGKVTDSYIPAALLFCAGFGWGSSFP